MKALEILVCPNVVCCDTKKASQEFISANFRGTVAHMFGQIDDHIACVGKCHMPGHTTCSIDASSRPDILCAGPPCQPWTKQRGKTGASKLTSAAEFHPGFRTTMDKLPALLSARQPLGAIIEEVPGLLSPNKKSGTSAAEALVAALSETFAGVEIVQLDSETWGKVSRKRLSLGNGAAGSQMMRHNHRTFVCYMGDRGSCSNLCREDNVGVGA